MTEHQPQNEERTFAYYEENYGDYLNSLDDKKRLAHMVACEVLGTSYQLPYTMDYLEYKKNQETEENINIPSETTPTNTVETTPTNTVEETPKKVRKVKRIKRKNIKLRSN
jgi:hypothetical protein